jgi:hypothetical protein
MAVIMAMSAARAVMMAAILRTRPRVRCVTGMFVHVFSLHDNAPIK